MSENSDRNNIFVLKNDLGPQEYDDLIKRNDTMGSGSVTQSPTSVSLNNINSFASHEEAGDLPSEVSLPPTPITKNRKNMKAQVVKKEVPTPCEREQPKNAILDSNASRVNYDDTCPVLFQLVEKQDWRAVIERCKEHPREASVKVFRVDPSKGKESAKVKWEFYPLHAAVAFKASAKAVAYLIRAHKDAVMSCDDQGMLPLHLAFRHSASEATIDLLLEVYPEGMNVKDKKGRLPTYFLKNLTSKKSEDGDAKEKITLRSYFSNQANLMKDAITKEQRSIFESKINQYTHETSERVLQMKKEHDAILEEKDEEVKASKVKCAKKIYDVLNEFKFPDSAPEGDNMTDAFCEFSNDYEGVLVKFLEKVKTSFQVMEAREKELDAMEKSAKLTTRILEERFLQDREELSRVKAELEEEQAKSEDMRRNHEKQVSDLEQTISDLDEKVEGFENIIIPMRENLSSLENDLSTAKAECEEMENTHISEITLMNNNLEFLKRSLDESMNEREKTFHSHEKDMSMMVEKQKRVESKNELLKTSLMALNTHVCDLKKALSDRDGKVERMEKAHEKQLILLEKKVKEQVHNPLRNSERETVLKNERRNQFKIEQLTNRLEMRTNEKVKLMRENEDLRARLYNYLKSYER